MAQFNWQYTTEAGVPYVIGLYHGEESGHLMVHCNSKVMLIDFQVLQAKNYSFFIEEELCELKIGQQPNGAFTYDLTINMEANTPRNRLRKMETEAKKAEIKNRVWVFLATVIFFAAIWLVLKWMR